jgi:hypothetical protein
MVHVDLFSFLSSDIGGTLHIEMRLQSNIIINVCLNTNRNQYPPQLSEEWLRVLYDYTMTWEHKIVLAEDV